MQTESRMMPVVTEDCIGSVGVQRSPTWTAWARDNQVGIREDEEGGARL